MELRLTEEELMAGMEGTLPDPSPTLPRGNLPAKTFAPMLGTDPSTLGFHPMLPMEIAMKTGTLPEIFEGYGLTEDEALTLMVDPLFLQAIKNAQEQLKEDGMSFKIKAKLQAEELLKKSWLLIHDPATPHNVRADLIKSTVRWAGLEPKTGAGDISGTTALQININLGENKT